MTLPFGLSATSWVLVTVTAVAAVALRSGRREAGLPPGPPTLPILGNLHQLKGSLFRLSDWEYCYSLVPTFGHLISLKLGNRTAIVLQDDGASFRELLEKRGSVYSSRPVDKVVNIVYRGNHPVNESNPYKWKLNRKLIMQHFHNRLDENIIRAQEAESTQLMMELTSNSGDYEKHIQRFTVSVLTKLVYGYRSPSADHFAVAGVADFARLRSTVYGSEIPPIDSWFGSRSFGKTSSQAISRWVYLFQSSSYTPRWLSPWRRLCESAQTVCDNTYGVLADTSRGLDSRDLLDRTTFAYKVFEQQKTNEMDDHWAAMLLAIVLEGGTDILAYSICTTVLGLLTHPEVQVKAQAEIDQICDEDTFPTLKNYVDLPYIRCIAKESLRWRPPFPLGVLHSVDRDDEYQGYKIPKGSTIATNIWAVHQNPQRFPEPEKFQPERFESHPSMTGDYMSNSDHLSRDHFAFGAGRRACPGVYVAEQAHILVASRILWAFDLVPVSPTQIPPTDAQTAYEGRVVRKPKEFPFTLRPRSEKRLLVIQREMERMQDGGGPLAKQDGILGEAENLKFIPEGYTWKPRSEGYQKEAQS